MALLHTPSSFTLERHFHTRLVAYPFPGNVVTVATVYESWGGRNVALVRLERTLLHADSNSVSHNLLPHARCALPPAKSLKMEYDPSQTMAAVARPRDGAVLLLRETMHGAWRELTLHAAEDLSMVSTLPLPLEEGEPAWNAEFNMLAVSDDEGGRVLIMRQRKYNTRDFSELFMFIYALDPSFECLASRVIQREQMPRVLGVGFPPLDDRSREDGGASENSVRVLLRLNNDWPNTRILYTDIEWRHNDTASRAPEDAYSPERSMNPTTTSAAVAVLQETNLFPMPNANAVQCYADGGVFRVAPTLDNVDGVLHFVDLAPDASLPSRESVGLAALRKTNVDPAVLRAWEQGCTTSSNSNTNTAAAVSTTTTAPADGCAIVGVRSTANDRQWAPFRIYDVAIPGIKGRSSVAPVPSIPGVIRVLVTPENSDACKDERVTLHHVAVRRDVSWRMISAHGLAPREIVRVWGALASLRVMTEKLPPSLETSAASEAGSGPNASYTAPQSGWALLPLELFESVIDGVWRDYLSQFF